MRQSHFPITPLFSHCASPTSCHVYESRVIRPSDAVVGSEAERSRIPNFAANPIESVGDEFHRHESVGREWALKRACHLSGKAKARIIVRVSENEYNDRRQLEFPANDN
jgi:hypothetical protein